MCLLATFFHGLIPSALNFSLLKVTHPKLLPDNVPFLPVYLSFYLYSIPRVAGAPMFLALTLSPAPSFT
jgi:hypothetical protein